MRRSAAVERVKFTADHAFIIYLLLNRNNVLFFGKAYESSVFSKVLFAHDEL